MPSMASTLLNRSVMAARTVGSFTPCSARNTMVPLIVPPRLPKCAPRMSAPRVLSESGAVGVAP